MKVIFWTIVRESGQLMLCLGDTLYWAGKAGLRRQAKRNLP